MGGGKPRASTTNRTAPRSPAPLSPPFLRPHPSFLRRQEPTPLYSATPAPRREHLAKHSTQPTPTPPPIHPSPLLGGRLGGGWRATSQHHQTHRTPISRAALSVIPAPLSVIPAPLSVIPAPPSVIPAQAGTNAAPLRHTRAPSQASRRARRPANTNRTAPRSPTQPSAHTRSADPPLSLPPGRGER